MDKMKEHQIEPHKVTKPIQLLAAWMVGLVVTNSSFLLASVKMEPHSWEKGALVIAAILNVPVFLIALFILQTRFRAELQEDTYYAEYLSKKTSTAIMVDKDIDKNIRIERIETQVANIISSIAKPIEGGNVNKVNLDWSVWPVGLHIGHPQFKDIRKSMKEAGIPIKEFFGKKHDLPKSWVVALSYNLPITFKAAILKLAIDFRFDGFQLWEPVREAEENEDVYIGSYGTSSFAPMNDEFRALLNDGLEEVDLEYYYAQEVTAP